MTMKARVLLILLVGLATMWMAGCGHYTCGATFGSSSCTSSGSGIGTTGNGSGGTGGGTAFLFFLDDTGVQMALEDLNMTSPGTFTPISNFVAPPLPQGPLSDGGAVIVNKQFLYVPFVNNTVYAFSIGTTGALTPVPNSPFAVAGGNSVAADPTGRFLFVGDSFANSISVFTVNGNDGSLTLTAGSPFSTSGVDPAQMATDGKGKYLYAVQGFPGSVVSAFSYNQTTGALTAVPGSPFAFNMAQIVGESSGHYLIGITQEAGLRGGSVDNHVYVFGITQTGTSAGALAQVAGSPFATTYAPISLTVHPNGAWVYTFNEDNLGNLDPMEGYQLSSSTGALTALSSSPFTSLKAFTGAFEQSGQFMFAIGQFVSNSGTSTAVYPYASDSSTGGLSSTVAPLGINGSFAVTDAP